MDLMIKKATVQDLENILHNREEFLQEALGEKPSEHFMEATRDYLESRVGDDSLLCYIATCNEKIVSSVIVCFFQVIPKLSNITGKIGYVFNVYTVQEYRRQGLASRLISQIIEDSKHLGIGELYLSATEEGKHLYEKFQFQYLSNEMCLKLI